MAKKNTRASEQPEKPVLIIARDEAERKLQGQIDKGKDLLARPISNGAEMEETEQGYFRWDEFNFELLKMMFITEYHATQYRGFGLGGGGIQGLKQQIDNLHRDLKYHVNHLESLKDRLGLIPEDPGITRAITVSEMQQMRLSKKVFIVHVHDELAKQSAARFIEKLGLEAIILHEKASLGKTIIEKFETYADVGYAVILLTPDDLGGSKSSHSAGHPLNDRARQNVVFEHGYFIGKFGRERVCALHKGVEIPSDLQGVLYVPMDDAGSWRFQLAKEMREAGLDVDLNKAI